MNSCQAEKSYLLYFHHFILSHHKQHPRERGGEEINAFLTHLLLDGKGAASTQ
ncbi:phage integrase N-terminal SAM-like domain-containing protein [Synechococcus elongatus]|uniref:phage integrase N-terminal SAM-like domain-containing protein n=1 Tax=Synechococcus elongatus TaxID=32046 RepID=UPI003CC84BE7